MKHHSPALLFTLLSVFACQAEPPQVSLERKETAGSVQGIATEIRITGTERHQGTGGPGFQEIKGHTRFRGRREVLATDESGNPTRVKYIVRDFEVCEPGDQPKQALHSGQVIMAELNGQRTWFAVDGQVVMDAALTGRYAFLNLPVPSGTGADVIFRTSEKHEIGRPWHLDFSAFEEGRFGAFVIGRDSSGTGLIEREETVNGIECTCFKGELNLDTGASTLGVLNLNLGTFPNGAQVASGRTRISSEEVLPRNPELPRLASHLISEFEIAIRIPNPNGVRASVALALKIEQTTALTFEPETLLADQKPPVALTTAEVVKEVRTMPDLLRERRTLEEAPRIRPTRTYRSEYRPLPDHSMDDAAGYLGSMGMMDPP